MRRFVKIFILILAIPLVILTLLIAYASLSDFRPSVSEFIKSRDNTSLPLTDSLPFNMLIWNLGYGGLDKGMDFFYDGGKEVRTPKQQLLSNIKQITEYLAANDSLDFMLLQEVDVKSRRSYHVNEVDSLKKELTAFQAYYGKNYDVFFVPLPMSNPMGSVNSGLLSLSQNIPAMVERISFPGHYAWPKRLFMLDRCFLVMHYPLANNKELLIINTHNEAYDDGSIRDQQMAFLRNYLLTEYNKGNYIIVGGDWNQCPPELHPEFNGEIFDTVNNKGIGAGFPESGWNWAYDNSVPTNRRLDVSYKKGVTLTTIIDFFLLSPNISQIKCRTIDLRFENSDHQPVMLQFFLK
jgi:endonuclease/exonuclease/phosphatase family metal-dependent hydrolase